MLKQNNIYIATQLRNIIEKLVTFKRITHSIVVKIYQTCSNIAKTNAKIMMLKLSKCQKIIKELEDYELGIIETIEKIYDYTQKRNIRESCHWNMLDNFR